MSKIIYILNGPSLNLLGTREPEIYGRSTLADVEKLCRSTAERHGFAVEFRQSNHAGYTTTSVAILDALLAMEAPVVEVHISNIHAREPFRRHSYVSRAARAVICGFGIEGYALAIAGLAAMTAATQGRAKD